MACVRMDKLVIRCIFFKNNKKGLNVHCNLDIAVSQWSNLFEDVFHKITVNVCGLC